MGHCPPPTVGPYEDPHSGRSPCLRKRAASGLTGLWDTKLSIGKHAQRLANINTHSHRRHRDVTGGRSRKSRDERCFQKVTRRALLFVLVTAQPSTTPLATSPTRSGRGKTSAENTHGDPGCNARPVSCSILQKLSGWSVKRHHFCVEIGNFRSLLAGWVAILWQFA